MTTPTFPQPFSPWPRWAPPPRVTGTVWARHVGGAPHAQPGVTPGAKPRA